jgi:hypothetical protein
MSELMRALEESVKLQSHYAHLLNDYDVGRRMTFPNARAWIDRLRETKQIRDIPEVVTLCGSTEYKQEFIEANFRLTMAGKIVISVGWFSHADHQKYAPTPDEKAALDELNLRKIDLSDAIFVINVGGHIGDSTRREIEYARGRGKRIDYLEPQGSA